MVETLTSNGADYPFDKWILPRGARCGKDLLDPETVDASIEVRSVGLVSIPYQVVPSIYSSARPEPDRSPIYRDYACMISSFVRARPWARPQTQTLSC